MKILRISCVLTGLLSLVVSLSAQTFTTLHSFNYTDGAAPFAGLIQATDGNLYGTTSSQGTNAGGTVFKITPGGTLTTLYNFTNCLACTDGFQPIAGLVQATNGNFYGTTLAGGVFNEGTVFEITPGGTLTTLYSFCAVNNCIDGQAPSAGLVLAANGNFYGTTELGGANGEGTVFKITPSGAFATIYNFCPVTGCPDGGRPTATLIQGSDGNLYGTTTQYGANGDGGTVFKMTTSGVLTTLYSFCAQSNCTDGGGPGGGLVQASNGSFYGETNGGGTNSLGTLFKITSAGTFTSLHSFNALDGENPYAPLIQATDGNFYGTTYRGGPNGGGTAFEITPSGTLTTLYNFCMQYPSCGDGESPAMPLLQDTNGVFYGTTSLGGANAAGTVFSLSTGLGPFVEARPNSGKVGTAVTILGSNLTGATSVTFDGTVAVFTVVSDSEITTTVPAGSGTGKVQVKTSGGTASSNAIFLVTPQVLSFSPTSGPVGTTVTITGVSLKQTLGVGFGDHVPATNLKIVSDTEVTANVPTGGKTGPVFVETKGGIGASSKIFTVTP